MLFGLLAITKLNVRVNDHRSMILNKSYSQQFCHIMAKKKGNEPYLIPPKCRKNTGLALFFGLKFRLALLCGVRCPD